MRIFVFEDQSDPRKNAQTARMGGVVSQKEGEFIESKQDIYRNDKSSNHFGGEKKIEWDLFKVRIENKKIGKFTCRRGCVYGREPL